MCGYATVVVVLNNVANLVRATKLDGISQFVMAYGGLRGAIAFALVVVLDEHVFLGRKMFITTTIVVIYFTNLVLVSKCHGGVAIGVQMACSARGPIAGEGYRQTLCREEGILEYRGPLQPSYATEMQRTL